MDGRKDGERRKRWKVSGYSDRYRYVSSDGYRYG